jgi:carbon monoxide dehydrogenase subunit G
MKVELDRTYPIDAPAAAAWAVLADIEAVAACMPGAQITERVDDTHYKGTVGVKLGPASLAFRGEIEVISVDPAARRMALVAKGMDSGGGSGAGMDLQACILEGEAGTCSLLGRATVTMSGKVAAFGARLALPVADQVLKQFARNFAAKAAALNAPEAPTA